jgi:hypothetical protein
MLKNSVINDKLALTFSRCSVIAALAPTFRHSRVASHNVS